MPAAGAASAFAETRSGSLSDPRDVPEAFNEPRQPDLASVGVSYDNDAGSVLVTASLYEPWAATSRAYTTLGLTLSASNEGGHDSCYHSPTVAYVDGYINFPPLSFPGLPPVRPVGGGLRVTGVDGKLDLERSVSPDSLQYTFSAASPLLVGRGFVCVTNIELFRPDPVGHCVPSLNNCQRIAFRYVGDVTGPLWFDGHRPPPAACADGVDNDGDGKTDLDDAECYSSQTASEGNPPPVCGNDRDDDGDGKPDTADPGCRGKSSGSSETDPAPVRARFKLTKASATKKCAIVTEVEVLPDIAPKKLFPFGKVKLAVRGTSATTRRYQVERKVVVGPDNGYVFSRLKPGRYRVTAKYLGDVFRSASTAVSRDVSVCASKLRQTSGTRSKGPNRTRRGVGTPLGARPRADDE